MQSFIIKHFSGLMADELHQITQAREAVFYLEQHVSCPDADDVDRQSLFMWAEERGRVIAFLRIIPAGIVYQEVSIGRVLVDAARRRCGLCRRMMQEALQYIPATWGPQPIRISAQRHLAGFYTSLGFETISAPYLEAGIPHVEMLRPAQK